MKEYFSQHKLALGLTIVFFGFIILVFFVDIIGIMKIQEVYKPYIQNEWYQANGVLKFFTLLVTIALTFSYKKDEKYVHHIALNKSLVIFIIGMIGAILARDTWLNSMLAQHKKDEIIDKNFSITKDRLLEIDAKISK